MNRKEENAQKLLEIQGLLLQEAVKKVDFVRVRELLELQRLYPKHLAEDRALVFDLANKTQSIPMIQLLFDYGAYPATRQWIRKIFGNRPTQFTEDLVACIVNRHKSDVKLIQLIFDELSDSVLAHGPSAENILEFLLDRGLPVNKIVFSYDLYKMSRPLELAVYRNKLDFVKLLLERGAPVKNKYNLISTAAGFNNVDMIKVLLKSGLSINEDSFLEHWIRESYSPDMVQFLIEHGADLNVTNFSGETPLYTMIQANNDYRARVNIKILIKELAKMKYEGKPICDENLDCLKKFNVLKTMFEKCLHELQKLEDSVFWNGLNLYDILKMRTQRCKLTTLTKNECFVSAFKSVCDSNIFKFYGSNIDHIFEKAAERRDVLCLAEIEMSSIFKNYLPDLVIRNVSYFLNEDLFYYD